MMAALAMAFWFRILACFWLGPMVLALVFGDRVERRLHRRFLHAALLSVTVMATLGVYFAWTERPRPAAPRATDEVAARGEAITAPLQPPDPRYGFPSRFSPGAIRRRALGIIRWPTLMLCAPWEAGAAEILPRAAADAVTVLIFVLMMAGSYRLWREGAVLPASWLAFLIPLTAVGPAYKATFGRYAVPLVPFMLMSFLVGLRETGRLLRRRGPGVLWGRRLAAAGAVAILLPNLALFAGDIYVQRHPEFYRVFRAGSYQELFSICRWLRDSGASGPLVCGWTTGVVVPALTCLPTKATPKDIRGYQPGLEEKVRVFARESGADYVLLRDFSQPWPIWHLPVGFLGRERQTRPYWRFWSYLPEADRLTEVDVPAARGWPTHLPWAPAQRSHVP
jgi:hypothetical protein